MSEFADWTRAYVMMGDSPVGIREVLLAADGSLYALLRGETVLGALQTVRLDDQGRMSAFIIDSTDAWAQMLTIGNAELAARLGSLQVFDRRGNVQFVEDFGRGPGHWSLADDGLNGATALDPTTFLHGGYSVKLTAGSTADNWARAQRAVSYVPTTRMGAEAIFSLTGATGDVELWLSVYSGTHTYEVKVRYDYANSNLDLWDGNPDWVTIQDPFTMYTAVDLFHHIKVVWDMEEETYVRVLVNGIEYPATHVNLEAAEVVFTPLISVIFTNTGRLGANDIVNFDSIIITNQEP